MRVFLDTNVLVYAIDRSKPAKHEIARELIVRRARDLGVSARVLSELYAVITHKFLDHP